MCGEIKSHSEYTFRTNKGKKYPFAYCKPCHVQWNRNNKAHRPTEYLEVRRKWHLKNKEKVNARKRELRNPDIANKKTKEWKQLNPHKLRSHAASYRAAYLNSLPKWRNKFFIDEIYHLAKLRTKMLGIQFHVDHIVPLQSDIVCGLHNEFNLQIITAKHNFSKGNRVWPEMP